MPHAPTKDVTTTEIIEDKDVTITRVTRDHDELGQHTHTEVVDKVTPSGVTHTESTDVEKDDGEHVHKEVVDKEGANGEHIHQTVTETDQGERHVQKVVTDTDEDGKHIHEEEKVVVNSTQAGDGTVQRVVTDRVEPGAIHHEEVTTVEKESGTSVARHTVDDVELGGLHVHEVTNSIEAGGSSKTMHTVVTDKDTEDSHIHTEQIEKVSDIQGDKRAVVDSKVVVDDEDGKHVDVIHQEVTNKGGVTTHHTESDKMIGGKSIHEVKDVATTSTGVTKQHVTVTDEDIPDGHVHTETTEQSTTNEKGSKIVTDEKIVVTQNDEVSTDTIHKESTVRVDPNAGLVATQHVEADKEVDGAHIHEEVDSVEIDGRVGHVRVVVTDKDTADGGHIHTEKVEQVSIKEGVEKAVVDEAVVIESENGVTVDVTHTETTIGEDGTPHVKSVHHSETARVENGVKVHEIEDSVEVDGESKTTEVIVTEEDVNGSHTYTETVKVTDANAEETTTKIEETIVSDNVIKHSESLTVEPNTDA